MINDNNFDDLIEKSTENKSKDKDILNKNESINKYDLSNFRKYNGLSSLREEHLKVDLKLKKQEIALRRQFSKLIFKYNKCLTRSIIFIIIGCGIKTFHYFNFELDVKVQMALISLVGVNSIGMLVIILNNLFPKKDKTEK